MRMSANTDPVMSLPTAPTLWAATTAPAFPVTKATDSPVKVRITTFI